MARLMSTAGLYGASRRRWVTTTVRDRAAKPAPDLIERNFTVAAPNCLWVADISYIPTCAGFLYLAVVLDAFSCKIVGWAMETHLRSELVLAALNMALGQRRPAEVFITPTMAAKLDSSGRRNIAFSFSKILIQGLSGSSPAQGFSRP